MQNLTFDPQPVFDYRRRMGLHGYTSRVCSRDLYRVALSLAISDILFLIWNKESIL